MFKFFIISLFIILESTYAYMIPQPFLNRRDAIVAASSVLLFPQQDVIKPICVIGASGATGTECVRVLANEQQHVRAVSRSHVHEDVANKEYKKYIQEVNIDIKDQSKIDEIIKSTSAVIFLANAKKYQKYAPQSGMSDSEQTYEDIDVHALKNIATACILHKVPRLVYVSASCRSCNAFPEDDIDQMSGIKCYNCRSKQQGETIIRNLYKNVPMNIDYTIIRTGFIINTGSYQGEQRGVKEIELNQDFTKSGMISKYDLAELCICAAKSKDAGRTTFEAYYRDSAQPYDIKESLNKCMAGGTSMEECFFGSAFKNTKPRDLEDIRNAPLKGSIFSTGFEHIGDTYADLFKNLNKDAA